MERRLLSPDSALASDIFDQFCNASTLKSLMALHRRLCDTINLRPTVFPQFYPKLRGKLRSWRAQALWTKFDKRASHKCYARGTACTGTKVLIIGAGPCGLRAAIEAQLLGAKVVVVEKRDRISRNNVLHLWPFVIHDLRALGAKKFFGKFCAGSLDHISIRQLQVILLKVALLLGVEIHVGVSFVSLLPPPEDQDSRVGWRAEVSPADHAVSQYEFDVLIGADGKRNTLEGFGRKEFRGKLAIAVTANFLNRHTEAEARVEEISGVAFIFNQKFFKDLYQATGIDLENIVYYKDDTHYFVMTAKKHSLLDKGVIIEDQADTARLLAPENVNREALMEYAREAADFSTKYQLPPLEFAVNHYGQPDVAMFDFTSMYAAENATRIIERRGHRLLTMLVGDSLLEPFWPTGSGCARGFLSSLDSCWAIRAWGSGTVTPLEVAAERESIYRLLAQTTPENLSKDFNAYTLEPHTRYPNLNLRAVLPIQARNLIDTDNPATLEVSSAAELVPSKRRRKESQVHPDTLLQWLKRQVALYDNVKVENVTTSFRDGMALGAIVHRYRPELLDFNALKPEMAAINNQLIFELLQREMGISPVMSGLELAVSETPDELSMLSYLSQVYDAFRGEIPHLRHKTIDESDEAGIALPTRRTPVQRASRTSRLNQEQKKRASLEREQPADLPRIMGRLPRKRRSHDKDTDREPRADGKRAGPDENFAGRIKEIEAKFKGTAPVEKKPRDLLRSIGKIERTDWNLAGIERKIEENRFGRGKTQRTEKVPKWNREKFVDKFSAVERKLRAKSNKEDAEAQAKYAEIDDTLKRLERKIKEGTALEGAGPRGANKVSAMAEQLAIKMEPTAEQSAIPVQKSSSRNAVILPQQGVSETCHFCSKRVYLMERLSAEGRFFHRGCFRCEYCGTSLRPNNYAFDRDGKYGSRFVCTQHYGLFGVSKGARARRKSEDLRAAAAAEADLVGASPTPPPSSVTPSKTTSRSSLDTGDGTSSRSVGVTPERVEFENLAGSEDDQSEARPASGLAEMDEEAWTDHNFGASCADDDSSSGEEDETTSDSEDDAEAFEEALGEPLSVEETRQLAASWQRRHSQRSALPPGEGSEISDDEPSSEGEWSCERDEIEDEDSSTATEGDAVARELLKQEQRLRERALRRRHRSQGSDTEVASDCTSTDSDSEEEAEEEEEENLATEIETDSEFELDNSLPTIMVNSELQVCQVKSVGVRGNLGGQRQTQQANKMTPTRKPQIKPSVPPPEMTPAVLKHRPNNFPGLDLSLRKKELLNRTHSTEGIASKMSLELKKRYLLGGDSLAFNKNVQKSGSASALDSRFRNFVDQISEQQKLLQPAASPSPTMQAFLEGQTKLSPSKTAASPLLTSMSTSNILQGSRADVTSKLPKVPSSFVHICGKKEPLLSPPEIKITPEIDDEATPIVETKDIIGDLDKEDIKKCDIENEDDRESDKISDLEKEKCEDEVTPSVEVKEIVEEIIETNIIDPDYRPRSPAHETSIIVPDISVWKDKKPEEKEEVEKTEESSEESESGSDEYDDSVEELPQITNVPQLEITDSEGVKIQTNEDHSPDKPPEEFALETELSDWAAEENSVGSFDEFQIDTRNITIRKRRTPGGNPTLAIEDDLSEPLEDIPKVDIMIVSETKSVIPTSSDVKSECEVCPKVDVMTVSETVMSQKTDSMTPIGAAIQDIDFMDSGEEHSDIENTSSSPEKGKVSSETKNIPLIEGYIQLSEDIHQEVVIPANDSSTTESISKSSDDFGTTPDTELENLVLVEAINAKLAKTSDEESLLLVDTDTTTSDVTIVLNNVNQNINCNQTSRPFIDPSYEAHVKRLQGRISPFSNAKDSIDIRKSRKSSTNSSSSTPSPSHSSKDDLQKSNKKQSSPPLQTYDTVNQNGPGPKLIDHVNNIIVPSKKEDGDITIKDVKTYENVKLKEESPSIKIIPNTPSTSRKLEEISRERSKQKDLIADLVISKLGTNSLERKRSLSGGPGIRKRLSSRSPTGSPRCSLMGPPVPPPPSEEISPPVPPPPVNFTPARVTETPTPKYAAKPPLSPSKKENKPPPDDDDDVFVTPRELDYTPKKRPISTVYATCKIPDSKMKLPETPLTHPEAFSCPDIRRALFVEERRDKARQEARERARLLSDQELGLSPEDSATLSALRDKARRRFDQEAVNDTPVAPPRTKKKNDSSKFYTDDTSIEETKTDPIVVKRGKKPKDRERRRSLIQAMSEFFSRKKDGSPSSKETSPTKSPTAKFHVKKEEEMPPPLPPPPQGYQGCQSYGRDSTAAEESPSEGEDSRGGGPGSNSIEGSSLRRSARSAKRVARQAQLKRLRMAHELQRQLEQLEEKQRVLEERGVQLEKALRGEDPSASSASGGEVALLQEWFELMRERSELRRYERELGVRAQELELQDRHSKLQAELRERMALDDANKSSAEVAEEGRILAEMLEVVERRDTLIALLEEDRQRYAEEDKDIEAQMLAKGLRLTPLRKESHV